MSSEISAEIDLIRKDFADLKFALANCAIRALCVNFVVEAIAMTIFFKMVIR